MLEIFLFGMTIVTGIAGAAFQLIFNIKPVAKYCFMASIGFLFVTLLVSLG